MPTVPTLSGQQVVPQPLGDNAMLEVRRSSEESGAGVAEGVARLGAAALDIWQQAQQQANDAQVNAGMAEADALGNALQSEFQRLHGGDAHAGLDDVRQRFADGMQRIRDGLSNDTQRRAFDGWAQRRRVAQDAATSAHALQEGEVQAADDYRAVKRNAGNRAALNANDPAQIAQAWADVERASDGWAAQRGFTAEQRTAQRSSDAGEFYGGVIRQHLAAGDDAGALQVFAAHAGEMDAGSRAGLAGPLRNGRLLGAGKRAVAAVYADGKPVAAMARELGGMAELDPQARRIALAQVANLAELHQRGMVYGEGMAAADAWQTVLTHPLGLLAVTPGQWQAMGSLNAGVLQEGLGPDREPQPLDQAPVADPLSRPLGPQEEAEQSVAWLHGFIARVTNADQRVRQLALRHGPDASLAPADLTEGIRVWRTGLAALNGDQAAQRDLRRLADKQRAIGEVLTDAGYRLGSDVATGHYDPHVARMVAWIEREGQAQEDGLSRSRPLTVDEWRKIAAQGLRLPAIGPFGATTSRFDDLTSGS